MNNKKVKQMMFSVGALDILKIIDIYMQNNVKSRVSGKGVPCDDKGASELQKVVARTYERAGKRGWFGE